MLEHCIGVEEGTRVGVPNEPFPQKPQEWGIPRLAKLVVNGFGHLTLLRPFLEMEHQAKQ